MGFTPTVASGKGATVGASVGFTPTVCLGRGCHGRCRQWGSRPTVASGRGATVDASVGSRPRLLQAERERSGHQWVHQRLPQAGAPRSAHRSGSLRRLPRAGRHSREREVGTRRHHGSCAKKLKRLLGIKPNRTQHPQRQQPWCPQCTCERYSALPQHPAGTFTSVSKSPL